LGYENNVEAETATIAAYNKAVEAFVPILTQKGVEYFRERVRVTNNNYNNNPNVEEMNFKDEDWDF